MQSDLRKHILSEYALVQIPNCSHKQSDISTVQHYSNVNKLSVLTEQIENSDPDEFRLSISSYLTHAIEESDPDEFHAIGSSIVTRQIEVSDPDEMRLGPTRLTYTVECSDEDEILLM